MSCPCLDMIMDSLWYAGEGDGGRRKTEGKKRGRGKWKGGRRVGKEIVTGKVASSQIPTSGQGCPWRYLSAECRRN